MQHEQRGLIYSSPQNGRIKRVVKHAAQASRSHETAAHLCAWWNCVAMLMEEGVHADSGASRSFHNTLRLLLGNISPLHR